MLQILPQATVQKHKRCAHNTSNNWGLCLSVYTGCRPRPWSLSFIRDVDPGHCSNYYRGSEANFQAEFHSWFLIASIDSQHGITYGHSLTCTSYTITRVTHNDLKWQHISVTAGWRLFLVCVRAHMFVYAVTHSSDVWCGKMSLYWTRFWMAWQMNDEQTWTWLLIDWNQMFFSTTTPRSVAHSN